MAGKMAWKNRNWKKGIKSKTDIKLETVKIPDTTVNAGIITPKKIDKIVLPSENESIHIITSGNVSLADLILHLIKQSGGKASTLYLSTLSFSLESLYRLVAEYDRGHIDDIILIRCNMFEKQEKVRYTAVDADFKRRGLIIRAMRTHAKIAVFQAGENQIVIAGSMNLSNHALLEQLVIYNNSKLYNFYEDWFLSSIEEYDKRGES